MADKSGAQGGHAGAAGRVTAPSRPEEIRNVVLVGHTGAGKTTLVESLLAATGAIEPARAGRGGHHRHRLRRGRGSGSSARSRWRWRPWSSSGIKVNLLDAPGYADFVGDLRAGLRAADAALFVVSAADGVDGSTRLLWEECAAVGMPRAVVVTKLDSARADFDEVVLICQRVFGDGVQPLYLPLLDDEEHVGGVIGLLSQKIYDYSDGRARRAGRRARSTARASRSARNALIEGIIAESEDETLMDRYLGGEDLDVEGAHRRPGEGGRPRVVLPGAAVLGDRRRLGRRAPGAGLDRAAGADDQGLPLAAGARAAAGDLARTASRGTAGLRPARAAGRRGGQDHHRPLRRADQPGPGVLRHAARPTLRSTSPGTAWTPAATPTTTSTSASARCPARWASSSARSTPGIAGDIVAVAKLLHAETGDTLSGKDDPLLIEPWMMPDPLLPVAIRAHAKSDEDKLSQSLARLVAEDPTLRLEMNPETRQLVLWCMGEAHMDVVLDRLKNRSAWRWTPSAPGLAARDLRRAAKGHGRHVKQSGGHGQYAICDIEVEPLPSGSGFEFVDKVVGGAVPRQLHPVGGEGRPGADGARRRGRLPGGRPARHPVRRQGALGGLLRHGLPDRRRAGAEGRRGQDQHPAAGAGRQWRSRSPTSTWAR